MLDIVYLLTGIALLTGGGEALMRGALSIARLAGISPMLSGLVIVGFGTSIPELMVSLNAALAGNTGIAIGNVVGSNIANILLILGLCACIIPLTVSQVALRRDALVVILASVLFIALSWDGRFSMVDGALMFGSLLAYVLWVYRSDRYHQAPSGELHAAEDAEVETVPGSPWLASLAVIAGLALLIVGSQILVAGAIGIANTLGIPEILIGLTLVAVGTSLPELTISVMAAIRGHADVAVGNVLGSNIFNILGILGISAMVTPLEMLPRVSTLDQWVMLGVAVLLMAFLASGRRLNRTEGVILLGGYVAYVVAGVVLA